jgi:hypothetical protein
MGCRLLADSTGFTWTRLLEPYPDASRFGILADAVGALPPVRPAFVKKLLRSPIARVVRRSYLWKIAERDASRSSGGGAVLAHRAPAPVVPAARSVAPKTF